jgi:hypothetical protein
MRTGENPFSCQNKNTQPPQKKVGKHSSDVAVVAWRAKKRVTFI